LNRGVPSPLANSITVPEKFESHHCPIPRSHRLFVIYQLQVHHGIFDRFVRSNHGELGELIHFTQFGTIEVFSRTQILLLRRRTGFDFEVSKCVISPAPLFPQSRIIPEINNIISDGGEIAPRPVTTTFLDS